jgi:FkbM family methyltransferase
MFRRFFSAWMQRDPAAHRLRQRWQAWAAVRWGGRGGERSWSQHGEDQCLARELSGLLASGYYVDVGANHPVLLSNTYRLYCLGMRGLCIEPSAALCQLHRRYRPGDTVFCGGAGEQDGLLTMYQMHPHTYSTFSAEVRDSYVGHGLRFLGEALIPVYRLATILRCHQPARRERFALLSVDTEGSEEAVLRGNDWDRYRPRLVVAEGNAPAAASSIGALLDSVGYTALESYGVNTIYRDRQAN